MRKRNIKPRITRAETILYGDNSDEIIPLTIVEKQAEVQEQINIGIWLEHCENCKKWIDKLDLSEDEAELEKTCLYWASYQWQATTVWLFERGTWEGILSGEEEKIHVEQLRIRSKKLQDADIPDLTRSGHYGWEADNWRDEMRQRLEMKSSHPDTGSYQGDWQSWTPERIDQCLALAFGYLE